MLVNYWDGAVWHWADQGLPGVASISRPNAITYLDAGTQRLYVFAQASTGHLAVNCWDGGAWHWADQGLPAGASAVTSPSAVTYIDAAQHHRLYVFAPGSNGHLFVDYWDGFSWHWADQGLPSGATGVNSPGAITYLDSAGHQRIYLFSTGSNSHLEVNWWDGAAWHWADLGLPGSAARVYIAYTFREPRGRKHFERQRASTRQIQKQK